MASLRVHLVAGARPNFMKVAPLYHALARAPWCRPALVHTGQHYDAAMSLSFFDELELPRPDLNLEVGSFEGLLVDAVKKFDAVAVVRGLRAVSDFELEFQMALMNRELSDTCETIFLMPSPQYSFVSSRMIKEIARLGGDISAFVPPAVMAALFAKHKGHS